MPMLLLLLALLSAASGQNDASVGKGDLVTVTGCVRGRHLKLAAGASSAAEYALRASEYVLEGSKETLQTLQKEHDGHYEEVTGTLKLPPALPGDVRVRQKELGPKTRVTVGTRTAPAGQDAPIPVRIIVSSYRHLANHCSDR
jgi:hypothetical protein